MATIKTDSASSRPKVDYNKSSSNSSLRRSNQLSVVFLLLIAVSCTSADVPDASSGSSSGEPSGDMISPKRQYFIAPRIGRAGAGGAAIWSGLEEGAFTVPGQIQAHRGFPGPLRSSLLFLVSGPGGSRRYIGPRSSGGLLPQARIGRRSSPVGLMPQPRVGRRSMDQQQYHELEAMDTDGASDLLGQQEVAVATLSDSSLSDAIESLINVAISATSDKAAQATETAGHEITIERPVHRTSAFVPRLGKREQMIDRLNLEKLLCANYGLDCARLLEELNSRQNNQGDTPLLALIESLAHGISGGNEENTRFPGESRAELTDGSYELMDLMAQQLRRETRAPSDEHASSSSRAFHELLVNSVPLSSSSGAKRVAFTPRIGR